MAFTALPREPVTERVQGIGIDVPAWGADRRDSPLWTEPLDVPLDTGRLGEEPVLLS